MATGHIVQRVGPRVVTDPRIVQKFPAFDAMRRSINTTFTASHFCFLISGREIKLQLHTASSFRIH